MKRSSVMQVLRPAFLMLALLVQAAAGNHRHSVKANPDAVLSLPLARPLGHELQPPPAGAAEEQELRILAQEQLQQAESLAEEFSNEKREDEQPVQQVEQEDPVPQEFVSMSSSVATNPSWRLLFRDHDPNSSEANTLLCVSLVAVMAGLVVSLYWSMGASRILCIISLIILRPLVAFATKATLEVFPFSKSLMSLQFFSCSALGFGVLLARQDFAISKACDVSSTVLATSALLVGCLYTSNMALEYDCADMVEIMAGFTPVIIVVITSLRGDILHQNLALPLLVMTLGMMLCTFGVKQLSAASFGMSLMSALLRAVQITLQADLMRAGVGSSRIHLDPVELLTWTSAIAALAVTLWSMMSSFEKPPSVRQFIAASSESSLLFQVFGTCLAFAVLQFATVFVINDLGAAGTEVPSQLKVFPIALISTGLLKQKVSILQLISCAMTAAGVFFYSREEARQMQQATDFAETAMLEQKYRILQDTPSSSSPLLRKNDSSERHIPDPPVPSPNYVRTKPARRDTFTKKGMADSSGFTAIGAAMLTINSTT